MAIFPAPVGPAGEGIPPEAPPAVARVVSPLAPPPLETTWGDGRRAGEKRKKPNTEGWEREAFVRPRQ